MSLRSNILTNIKNVPGRKIWRRKVVVIYADDYGSIRIKNSQARKNLTKMGVNMEKNRYSRFDTLADTEDLYFLFDILTSVKDINGHYACFTPFANIANPDFEKIKNSNFTTYFREPFTETLKHYGANYDGVYELWKQGISENIFYPEYHGTEHINVKRFMQALRDGHKSTLAAFNNQCVCVPTFENEEMVKNSTSVFDIDHASDNESLMEDIKVGMDMFENVLGYRPKQFTPGAGIYSPVLHQCLSDNGIKYINVQRYRSYPLGDNKYVKHFLYNGKLNEYGQKYIVRNCPFEPTNENGTLNNNAADICLKNVDIALRWNAPAIISTHRVNFVGTLDKTHRDFSYKQLKKVLVEIIKRWPNVEFMNGDQMAELL